LNRTVPSNTSTTQIDNQASNVFTGRLNYQLSGTKTPPSNINQ